MTQPRLVGGRYELGELIGYGGMAEVHRGRDIRLNRDVAIKVLRADLARDPSFLNRFRREAHSAAGLNHPSIVSVFDTGEDAGADGVPVPFIVMEFVQGRTLRDILRAEGKLPESRAMEIVADICSALDFSHRNGIIHRDIKPANVMITTAGAVKVMDFGIARAVADTSATVTQTANVIGTAQYLSPEQARGESVDARSDVYSTGCLFYELVTGGPPFQGDSPVAVAYQHVRENPVLPSARNPEVSRAVDSIIMKALAKNQLNRYQSAADMRSDLQRALANQPVTAEAVMTDAERTQFIARTPAPVVAARRPVDEEDGDDERHRTGLIWAAVVVALLLVIGIGTWLIAGTGGTERQNVTLDSVIGQTRQAAIDDLRKQKLTPEFGGETSEPCKDAGGVVRSVSEGQVCITTPAPGAELQEGSVVRFYTYKQQLTSVPLVEGMKFADAVAALKNAKLTYTRTYRNSAEDKDTVLEQGTSANEAVRPGTKIELVLSTGTIKLPDVTGKTLAQALELIPDDFGNPKTVEQTTRDESKNGLVASQDPGPGAYKPSRKITLTIYQYSPPQPTCTPGPTGTPTSPTPGAPTTPTPTPTTTTPGTLPVCGSSGSPSGAPSS